MAALTPTNASRKPTFQPWLKSRHGWIGVDIGTVATKLAQVQRVGDSLQLTAHWIIDNYGGKPLTKDRLQCHGCLPFQSQLREARSMFRGRRAAATLPLSMTEVGSMELPAGTDDELRNMIHEELAADNTDGTELCFDFLPTQAADSTEGDMGSFSVFAAAADVAASAANSLCRAGLDCEVLNSLPCAMARAIELCEPAEPEAAIAALDFGYSSAILVVARGGQLLFTRQLRGCSLQTLLKPLQDGLALSAAEIQQLLGRYANSSAADS
jgi:Tfp pilus assembly PilM family ATPase